MVTVLGNLIDNAMDACDREDPWVEVTVSQDDGTLLIRVADSGPGMDAGTFEKAMQRGYSTKSGTDAEQHGLGLALVAQVVKRHNGTLTADVTYGSVVTVTVRDRDQRADRRGRAADRRGAPRHISVGCRAFRWQPSRTPPATRCVPRPKAAATETPIDLVLLDIGLPDASGIALASGLSGLRPAPDIIAITSERDLEMVRAAVGHGALAYLLKPFTFAAFRDRLERYQRYREALPAGTDAASQAEVDRALAELRVSTDRSTAPKGAAAGTNDEIARAVRDSADGITADAVAKQVGVSRVTAWRYLERLADEGTVTRQHRLRQGRPPQDPLPVALSATFSTVRRLPAPACEAQARCRRSWPIKSVSSSDEWGATDITVMVPVWSAMYSRLLSGLTATHDGSGVTVRVSTTEFVSVHSTPTCS